MGDEAIGGGAAGTFAVRAIMARAITSGAITSGAIAARAIAAGAIALSAAGMLLAAPQARAGETPAVAVAPAKSAATAPVAIASMVVAPLAAAGKTGFDGVVEAVRQTVAGAQVAGSVVAVDVKVGDAVRAGQVIARIDARAAEQNVAASDAQVQAARASLDVARKEVERQRTLHSRRYISDAALDRAEAQFKATQAQVDAQLAQAGAARTQSGFFVVRAPYAGIVAEVPVTVGDMAMPGKPLAVLYDPSALRVAVSVPQTALARAPGASDVEIELPGAVEKRLAPVRVAVLPTVDAASHTVIVRLDLPAGMKGVAPGMFARAWLPAERSASDARIAVPAQALVRRAELTAVYVLDPNGRALLRMVRTGRASADQVEIISGLAPGERVVTDPRTVLRSAAPALAAK